jgi:hypothetical protein
MYLSRLIVNVLFSDRFGFIISLFTFILIINCVIIQSKIIFFFGKFCVTIQAIFQPQTFLRENTLRYFSKKCLVAFFPANLPISFYCVKNESFFSLSHLYLSPGLITCEKKMTVGLNQKNSHTLFCSSSYVFRLSFSLSYMCYFGILSVCAIYLPSFVCLFLCLSFTSTAYLLLCF